MIKGKTPSGYKYSIDEGIKTDWLFLKALSESESEDINIKFNGTIRLVSVIFGNDKTEKEYYEFVSAKHNGRVPMNILSEDLKSIVLKVNERNETVKK